MTIASQAHHGGDSGFARHDPVNGGGGRVPLANLIAAWGNGAGHLYTYQSRYQPQPSQYAFSLFENDWGILETASQTALTQRSRPNGHIAVTTPPDTQRDLLVIWLDVAKIMWARCGVRGLGGPGLRDAPNAVIFVYVNGKSLDLILSKWGNVPNAAGHDYYHWEIV
jgi:hypothetical protein